MTFLLIILALICLWRMKTPGYQEGFLSKDNTTAIKGVFTFLILFSHARGYLTLSDSWKDSFYCVVQDHLGQLIVAVFFLYSGFGIWESFQRNKDYEITFFTRRFLKVLLHFDIAIALFVVVQLLFSITYTPRQYLLCWIGWEDVGNSNWFIFVILCLYLIALAAMYLQRRWGHGGIAFCVLLTAVLWIVLRLVSGKESWWVDTMAAFPLGIVLSSQKERILDTFRKQGVPYLASASLLVLFIVIHRSIGNDIYGIATCIFCCLIVALSSWIHIGNPVLVWAGKNAFTVYIIQRLPMILCTSYGINQKPALFLAIVISVTFLLAEGLSRLYATLDKKLFAHA